MIIRRRKDMKKFLAGKKDNKGFSLVELIVVILIMGIIAVALAPQVMKWVGKSRDSADDNNEATLKSAVSAAVADYMAEYKIENNVTFMVYKDGIKEKGGTNFLKNPEETTNILLQKVLEVMNGDFPTLANKVKSGGNEVEGVFQVTILEGTGQVTIDRVPASSN